MYMQTNLSILFSLLFPTMDLIYFHENVWIYL